MSRESTHLHFFLLINYLVQNLAISQGTKLFLWDYHPAVNASSISGEQHFSLLQNKMITRRSGCQGYISSAGKDKYMIHLMLIDSLRYVLTDTAGVLEKQVLSTVHANLYANRTKNDFSVFQHDNYQVSLNINTKASVYMQYILKYGHSLPHYRKCAEQSPSISEKRRQQNYSMDFFLI